MSDLVGLLLWPEGADYSFYILTWHHAASLKKLGWSSKCMCFGSSLIKPNHFQQVTPDLGQKPLQNLRTIGYGGSSKINIVQLYSQQRNYSEKWNSKLPFAVPSLEWPAQLQAERATPREAAFVTPQKAKQNRRYYSIAKLA